MLFHAPEFLVLMAAVLGVFYRFPRHRLVILALANMLFYGAAGGGALLLFMAVATCTYFCSRQLPGKYRKWFFAMGLAVNLANLLFFKYSLFFLTSLQDLLSLTLVAEGAWLTDLVLPIGISFYTFQQIAYLVDVYQEKINPARTWLVFWGFVSFFGLVLAGPIMRGKDLLPQVSRLQEINFQEDNARHGALLFLTGLVKKVVVADTLAVYADRFFAQGLSLSGAEVWVAAYLFAFQLFFDFSGYSDMALGMGRLFGLRLSRNFATPYLAANATEFWRRWHITLSTWIRDYVYIPLGGGRRGEPRKYLNLIVAMGVSGLWHGAAWTFIIWGLYHGLLLIGHNLLLKFRKRWGFKADTGIGLGLINTLAFFHLTCIGWVFFRVADLGVAAGMVRHMLYPGFFSMGPHLYKYLALTAFLYGLHFVEDWIYQRRNLLLPWWQSKYPVPIRAAAYALCILVVVFFLQATQSSFIYFQF